MAQLNPVMAPKVSPTAFDLRVASQGASGLISGPALRVIQVNVGLKCNLTCTHCHVNSSPKRKEEMGWKTMEAVVALAKKAQVQTVDITGGAPEMNPQLQRFISALRGQGIEIIVRTNLTILDEPTYEDFPEFFRSHQVQLVASLPCYSEENVDRQRGEGVYSASIKVIRRLNVLGYGIEPELPLTLIYNPGGPVLPPSQSELERDYKRELKDRFAIHFTHLHTITNLPIGRFRSDLRRQKILGEYMQLLQDSFNPETVEPLMCRHQVSVSWDGSLHDCDFNLALRWPTGYGASQNVHSVDIPSLLGRRIVTGDHCFGCTAGAGSSCSGSLV